MSTATYTTQVIGEGNHASLHIPDEILETLGANRRAPLKVTINGHSYRTTATAVAGQCRIVFPQQDRTAANAQAGENVRVHLELESGYREVEVTAALAEALNDAGLTEDFAALTYSKRREYAKQVAQAKAESTRNSRIAKILAALKPN